MPREFRDGGLPEAINHAMDLHRAGRYPQALTEFREILTGRNKGVLILNGSTRNRLILESRVLSRMVDCLRHTGSAREGLPLAQRALQIDRQVHGDRHNDVAADYLDLALIHLEVGDPIATMENLDALERAEATEASGSPEAWMQAHRTIQLGSTLAELGYAERGAAHVRAALPRLTQNIQDEGVLAMDLSDAAGCLMEVGHHNDAEPLLLQSIDLERKSHGPRHPFVGIRHSNLATLYHESGRFDEAIRAQQDALSFPAQTNDPNVMKYRRAFLELFNRDAREMGSRARRRTTEHEGHRISYDFFISYNTHDEAFVRQLDEALTALGLTVWTFRKDPGSSLPRSDDEIIPRLEPHILAARCFIVISSRTSVTSLFVYEEIEVALKEGVPVLVIYPDGTLFIPAPASRRSDGSREHLMKRLGQILREDVNSYFGLGVPRGTFKDLARALLFRLLLMAEDHPLHRGDHSLDKLRREVRHGTRLRPIFCDEDAKPLPGQFPRRNE